MKGHIGDFILEMTFYISILQDRVSQEIKRKRNSVHSSQFKNVFSSNQ